MQKQKLTLKDFYQWNIKTCGTGIFQRRLDTNNQPKWDTSLKIFQDLDYILQLGDIFPNGYMYIPIVLFEYSQKFGIDGICSNATQKDWIEGFRLIYKKHKTNQLMKGEKWYHDKIINHNSAAFQIHPRSCRAKIDTQTLV